MLAISLAKHGIEHRIVDANPERSPLSRALAVHARTLEILDSYGIAADLVARGRQLSGASMYAEGRLIVRADFDELDTRFPFLLCLPQSETEAVLEGLLVRSGSVVERSTKLVDLDSGEAGVGCRLLRPDGSEETLRARWVVGADGAHSAVRKAARLAFPGHRYPEAFWLADADIEWDVSDRRVTTFFSSEGLLACFPLPSGQMRVVASTPEGAGEGDPTDSDVEELLRRRSGQEVRIAGSSWRARFAIHCRQVERYRAGRVFLAGDAAHVHSPLGGQGMNTGMQDAHNLAWKLALVEKGLAGNALLESYEAERHRVGEELLRATDIATRVATIQSPLGRRVRDRVTEFLASMEVVQERVTRRVAELDLAYEKSPIVGEFRSSLWRARFGDDEEEESPTVTAWLSFDAAPRPGQRAPDGLARDPEGHPVRLSELWQPTRHTLLLFDGRASTRQGYEDLSRVARTVRERHGDVVASVVVVADSMIPEALAWDGVTILDPEGDLEYRYGARAECLYLVRPDLYLGYRSQPAALEPLLAYLDDVLS